MSSARKSAKYLFIGGLFSKVISFIGSIILARILFPEDFGYLLIASLITGFIQIFGNIGFETFYLQQNIESKDDEEIILNVTYKLRILVNTLLFIIQLFVSYIAETYYNNPLIGEMMRIFALTIPITALSQINIYILRKKLNYKPEVYANLGRDISGTITRVIFAMLGFGAVSFAIGSVIGNLLRYFILKYYQNFKIKWNVWDSNYYQQIFFFGKHSLLGGISLYLTKQIDKIFLSTYFSIESMGNYYFANSQAQSIFSYIIAPQNSLILSYSAKNKEDSKKLFYILSQIGYGLGIVVLPIVIFLFLYTGDIINLIFGAKWLESVTMLQIFIIYYFLINLTFPFSGIITAYGLPHINSKLLFSQFILLVISLGTIGFLFHDIYLYLSVYVIISLVFSLLKAYIAINKVMKQSLLKYIISLKNMIVLGGIYYISSQSIDCMYDGKLKLIWVIFIFIVISLLLHLTIFRKEFIKVLIVLLGEEHKLVKKVRSLNV